MMVTLMIKVIGIDPDKTKCGVVECVDGKFNIESYKKYNTAMVIEDVPVWVNQGYVFAVEDVNKNKATYYRRGMTNQSVANNISQKVGMVKAAGTIIVDYIEHHGGQVILVSPGIGKQTKKDAELFKRLTGYTGRTNEDTRDAYWIAHYAYNKLKGDK